MSETETIFCQYNQRDIGRLGCLALQDEHAKMGELNRRCGDCVFIVLRADTRRKWRRKLKRGKP